MRLLAPLLVALATLSLVIGAGRAQTPSPVTYVIQATVHGGGNDGHHLYYQMEKFADEASCRERIHNPDYQFTRAIMAVETLAINADPDHVAEISISFDCVEDPEQ